MILDAVAFLKSLGSKGFSPGSHWLSRLQLHCNRDLPQISIFHPKKLRVFAP